MINKNKLKWGTKMCTSKVQIFVGYKGSKWGTVPQNGVQMATLCITVVEKENLTDELDLLRLKF
jgi:hypothetical protein